MMDFETILIVITAVSAFAGVGGYFLMRARLMRQLADTQRIEEELTRQAYEMAILREIGERIGYSLDAAKIVEIISGSLGKLLPYSTVSYMIISENSEKIKFNSTVAEPVSEEFINDVKRKMLAALAEMLGKPVFSSELDESITGLILDEKSVDIVASFFNLPIVISDKLIGIINVASKFKDLYTDENTEVLYRIARLASETVSKLQEVLENEKARLSQAVQSLSDGLIMVDTQYQLVLVNRKLCQLLSLISEPSLFDIVNALSGNLDLRSMMEEAINTKSEKELAPREIVVRDKVFEVLASKVSDKKLGTPMGVVVLFHDRTDAKSLEKLRRDFTAMMVHELRAPLTNIRSTVELVKDEIQKIPPEEMSRALTTIDVTSRSMLELVNDLLDASKLEAGKFDVICEKGDIAAAVKERVEIFKPAASEKNLKLTVEVEKELPEGYFDKIRIKQVLNNLLSNALKYTDRGEIKVRVEKEVIDGHAVDILVSIADTGIGIEPDQIRTLFSKFGQLMSGRGRAGLKSSGLGLYIARGIVEAWSGKIWGKSQGAGAGSTFYFTVPIADELKNQQPIERNGLPIVNKVAHA